MPLSVRAKTFWLLIVGAAAVVLVLLPIRLAPVVPQSIDALTVQARMQLIQKYEPPAQQMLARVDTLRRAITLRYGGTRPSQDSLLGELGGLASDVLSVIAHLRDPRRATFEERRSDINIMLEDLASETNEVYRQLRDYLK